MRETLRQDTPSNPTRVSRRRFLRASTGALAAAAAASPWRVALAQARERLVLIDWGGAYHAFFAGDFKTAFERRYRCDLVVQSMGTAEKNARLIAEAERPTMHVVMVEPQFAAKLATTGVVVKVSSAEVPNLKNLYPVVQDFFGGVGVPHGIVTRGLAYNHQRLKSVPTWETMWQPEYKGHVGGPANGSEEMAMQFLAAAAMINGGDQNNLEPGWQKLREFRKQAPIWYGTNAIRNQHQQRDELWMTLSSNGHTYALADKGVPLGFTLPPGKSFLSGSALVVPKAIGPSKLEFAFKLADMIISDEWQAKAAPTTYWAPVVRGIKLDPKVMERTARSEEVERLILLDWVRINKDLDKIAERWRNEIVG